MDHTVSHLTETQAEVLHNTYIEAASDAHTGELNGDAAILAHVSPLPVLLPGTEMQDMRVLPNSGFALNQSEYTS